MMSKSPGICNTGSHLCVCVCPLIARAVGTRARAASSSKSSMHAVKSAALSYFIIALQDILSCTNSTKPRAQSQKESTSSGTTEGREAERYIQQHHGGRRGREIHLSVGLICRLLSFSAIKTNWSHLPDCTVKQTQLNNNLKDNSQNKAGSLLQHITGTPKTWVPRQACSI